MAAIQKSAYWVEPEYKFEAADAWVKAREARDPAFKAAQDAAKAKIAELKQKSDQANLRSRR